MLFVIITLLALVGSLADNLFMGAGARKGGASWLSIVVALSAGILGTIIFPPIGGLIAAPLAVLLLEYYRLRDWQQAWQAVFRPGDGLGAVVCRPPGDWVPDDGVVVAVGRGRWRIHRKGLKEQHPYPHALQTLAGPVFHQGRVFLQGREQGRDGAWVADGRQGAHRFQACGPRSGCITSNKDGHCRLADGFQGVGASSGQQVISVIQGG